MSHHKSLRDGSDQNLVCQSVGVAEPTSEVDPAPPSGVDQTRPEATTILVGRVELLKEPFLVLFAFLWQE